jgi:hypothetical protein
MIDPVIMSFFLAVPVAALLWTVLCFSVALVGYCIQDTDPRGSILLVIVVGVVVMMASTAAIVLRHIWRSPIKAKVQTV